MSKISILEQTAQSSSDGFAVSVSFDDADQFPGLTVRDPLTPRNRAKLEWHFEQYVQHPYLKEVEPPEAQKIIAEEGEALFSQIFGGPEIYHRYQDAIRAGLNNLLIEISGSSEFHSLHWEALKDPGLPRPLVLDALILRKDTRPQPLPARLPETPVINLLLVTSRPRGRRDVGYRTISRPLVELLRNSQIPVKVHILRPPTYRALSEHLNEKGSGFYQVVHFDVHGALLTFDAFERFEKEENASSVLYQPSRYGRPQILPFDGRDAFLFFDLYREPEKAGDDGFRPDPVRANELADLLLTQGIPLIVLNACQSAKQLGGQGERDGLPIVEETSLASRLMRAGAQTVLAMSYSVTVTAAEILMKSLYQDLFRGKTFQQAVQSGRRELANDRSRRAVFNRKVSLEDWLLPVVYQKQAVELKTRKLTGAEEEELLIARRESGGMPEVEYGFHGRDIDILNIERRLLLKNNILLIRGMGGAGKTTLLQHLAWWWRETDFVPKVFYFGYDQKAYTLQEIMFRIAEVLYDRFEFADFQAKGETAQIEKLTRKLRTERHLLILDNLESIQGEFFAIKNTLSPDEQAKLKELLAELRGSPQDFAEQKDHEQTIVLIGSRSAEEWLAERTFGENLYDLGGLDNESATQFADEVLRRNGVTHYRRDDDFRKLMKLLAGFPLPMKVILENLKRQPPADILSALEVGQVDFNTGTAEEKTADILKCIEYSYSSIPIEKQELLLCLAPFNSVVSSTYFHFYIEELKGHPILAHLKYDLWNETLLDATRLGLISKQSEAQHYVLQPTFPFFLRVDLGSDERIEFRAAIYDSYCAFFNKYCSSLRSCVQSGISENVGIARWLVGIEFENIGACMESALKTYSSVANFYSCLSDHYDFISNSRAGLKLGLKVYESLQGNIDNAQNDKVRHDLFFVLDDIARRQLELNMLNEADVSYQDALKMVLEDPTLPSTDRDKCAASIFLQLGTVNLLGRNWENARYYYGEILADDSGQFPTTCAIARHQLGNVASEQFLFNEAKEHYEKALAEFETLNLPERIANTQHSLGTVLHALGNLDGARAYYEKSLSLKMGFGNPKEIAATLFQLGVVAQDQADYINAEEFFQQALRIFIQFDDAIGQATVFGQLCVLRREQERFGEGKAYGLVALEKFHSHNAEASVAKTLLNLKKLWLETREEDLIAQIGEIMTFSKEEVRELLESPQH